MPLAQYIDLANSAAVIPAGAPPVLAFSRPAGVRAVAALLGVDPAPILADVSELLDVERMLPWLFNGELPDSAEPVLQFTHGGTSYQYVGFLHEIRSEQMEALLGFLEAHEQAPLNAAPHLLAVLYTPQGGNGEPLPQTARVVEATGAAFASLPMSLAWPALTTFLREIEKAPAFSQSLSRLRLIHALRG